RGQGGRRLEQPLEAHLGPGVLRARVEAPQGPGHPPHRPEGEPGPVRQGLRVLKVSRRTAIPALFFLLGLSLFVYLVDRIGAAEILDRIVSSGWGIVAAFFIWFVIYLLNTSAWRLALGRNGDSIGAVELFMITVSGFVINYITPLVALGGEPYKVGALSGRLGAQGAIPAVVLYRMVHLLGYMSLLFAG